jgi:hypothetical protein
MECTTVKVTEAGGVDLAETPVGETRKLETVTCGRCCGSGEYSYCSMYGKRCFKCGGSGVVFTKRGVAAQNYLIELRSAPVGSLTVGQVVKMACGLGGKVWMKVEKVTPVENIYEGRRSFVNNVEVPVTPTAGVEVEFNKMVGTYRCDEMVRIAQTNERLRETYRLAMDYQDSLTQSGTVRKARKSGGKKEVAEVVTAA